MNNIKPDIKLLTNNDIENSKEGIKSILNAIDNEFVPPLSSRLGTTQLDLSHENNSQGIESYFHEMLKQKILLAKIDRRIIGFMSFIINYSDPVLKKYKNISYISTIGVYPAFRGQKIATILYNHMISNVSDYCLCNYLATRTWSTNYGHLKILNDLKFKEINRIKDHRKKGVDTVYFLYKLNR